LKNVLDTTDKNWKFLNGHSSVKKARGSSW